MARLGSAPPESTPVDGRPGGPADVPEAPESLIDRFADLPVDLASLEAAQDEKRQLLDQAAAAARQLPAVGELPAGVQSADLPTLLHRFYGGEPAAEVLGRDPAELATLALGHLRLAATRPQGAVTIDVHRRDDGGPVLRVVTDDMPFLVDSVAAEVVRQGVVPDHVVHPVVVVRRNVAGQLLAFCDSADAGACGVDALPESWMAVVLSGLAAPEVTGGHRIVVTKGDTRSTVHRLGWLDVVAVTLPGAGEGGRDRQHRLVGIFPTEAYTSSVRDVPLVRQTVAQVLDRSGVPADSHSGKELLDVLETYPRDELLQFDVPALEAALASVARSWTDDLADALVARHDGDAQRLLARAADAFPAAHQEDFPAEFAVEDLARLDRLAPGELDLRLWTPAEAAAGERRLTVYRVGERLGLSDVLPVLQHVGVDDSWERVVLGRGSAYRPRQGN